MALTLSRHIAGVDGGCCWEYKRCGANSKFSTATIFFPWKVQDVIFVSPPPPLPLCVWYSSPCSELVPFFLLFRWDLRRWLGWGHPQQFSRWFRVSSVARGFPNFIAFNWNNKILIDWSEYLNPLSNSGFFWGGGDFYLPPPWMWIPSTLVFGWCPREIGGLESKGLSRSFHVQIRIPFKHPEAPAGQSSKGHGTAVWTLNLATQVRVWLTLTLSELACAPRQGTSMRHCYQLAHQVFAWMWQWLKLLQGCSEFSFKGYRTNIVSHLWNPTVRATFPGSPKSLKSGVQMNKPLSASSLT